MRTFTRFLATFGTFLALLLSGNAFSQTLYAADGAGGNPACRLYTLNPATGAMLTNIGPIGMAVTGLAMHPITGVLYGTTGGASPVNPNSLITINTSTGAGTLVGPHGTGPVADITFRADGTLFGWSEGSDDLVTINLTTGVLSVVADSGIGTSGSGIAMSPAGVLFYAGSGAAGMLRTINQVTGLPTNVANMAGAPIGGQVPAMAFNSAGVLYAVDFAGGGAGGAGNLVTVNTATAAVTNVGVTINGLDAIAFANATGALGAPTLSEWGLIMLAGLMALFGMAHARRRHSATRV